jgi:hypothetical protein
MILFKSVTSIVITVLIIVVLILTAVYVGMNIYSYMHTLH